MANRIRIGSSTPVYSTDRGRLCPVCGAAKAQCRCKGRREGPQAAGPTTPADGVVRLWRQSKGRGGKTVTLVEGLPVEGDELRHWAKRLKQHCGVGGSLKDGRIEIQGDQRERIAAVLRDSGFTVKFAGG